jgi:hypothetical protein
MVSDMKVGVGILMVSSMYCNNFTDPGGSYTNSEGPRGGLSEGFDCISSSHSPQTSSLICLDTVQEQSQNDSLG